MVNPGGESTMLGQWRIVLRQAEEAARLGRYEEAYALATRPGVSDHHHAVQFRSRLALELIARATRRGCVDDLAGAIEDLDLAERIGAPPDSLAAARLNLADRVADEVRLDLDAGEPIRVLERVEELTRHKIGGPALRRTREIAEAWQNGLADGRRGEFGRAQEQLDRAERLAAGAGAIAAQQAVATAKIELENRQKGATPKVEALYTALSEGNWSQVLSSAEAVLSSVPEHPAARQARSRAWQQIAAIGPAAARWPHRAARAAPHPRLLIRSRSPSRDLLCRRKPKRPTASFGSTADLSREAGPSGPMPGAEGTAPKPRFLRSRLAKIACPVRPARWRESKLPAPKAGSSCGSTRSEVTWFAWTIASYLGVPARTATRMFRSWATFRGITPRWCETVRVTCCRLITPRSSTASQSLTRRCCTTAT